jgi:hypothetical protein
MTDFPYFGDDDEGDGEAARVSLRYIPLAK